MGEVRREVRALLKLTKHYPLREKSAQKSPDRVHDCLPGRRWHPELAIDAYALDDKGYEPGAPKQKHAHLSHEPIT